MNTTSVMITPDVLAEDFKRITINGEPAESEVAYAASLNEGENRFSIEVMSSDNSTRTYTLTITRGIPSRRQFGF